MGLSSGANLAGALRIARNTSNAVVVVIFPDGGEKYLSERFWDQGEHLVLGSDPGDRSTQPMEPPRHGGLTPKDVR